MRRNNEQTAICDKCNKPIEVNKGYLNYALGYDRHLFTFIDEVGCLLYCNKCIKQVFSKDSFEKISYWGDNSSIIKEFHTNTINLVKMAKLRGYAPEEAIGKAKELAGIWWKNNYEGSIMAKRHAELSWAILNMSINPSLKKKWWQFWK
jgi:hypothetical protein